MTKQTISAYGIGQVPEWMADEGLELAVRYFDDHDLDPVACFTAYEQDPNSELGMHWTKAGEVAEQALPRTPLYDNSAIILEIIEEVE